MADAQPEPAPTEQQQEPSTTAPAAEENPAEQDGAAENAAADSTAPAADEQPAAEEQPADGVAAPESEEEAALKAELAQLEEATHDADTEWAAAVEEAHARDAAEERLAALKTTQEAAEQRRDELSTQRDELKRIAALRKAIHEVYTKLRAEENAAHSDGPFGELWAVTVGQDDLDEMVAAEADDGPTAEEAGSRLQAAVDKLAAGAARVEELRAADEAAEAAGLPADGIAAVDAASKELTAELKRMDKLRAELRGAINEQRFHLRRGTHIKPRTYTRKAKDEFLELEHAKQEHDRLSQAIVEESYQRDQALRDLEAARRELSIALETAAERKATLLKDIEEMTKAVEAVDWEYQTLSRENADLRSTRRDMIRSQGQIRMHLRQ